MGTIDRLGPATPKAGCIPSGFRHRTRNTVGLRSPLKSLTRPSFWRAYGGLDSQVRGAARRAYGLFAENPDHPSLRFKKLGGYENVWSVRINEQYRAVGERSGDTIVWVWIGSHNDFDKLFGRVVAKHEL